MESDGLVLIEYQSQTYTLTSKGEEWLTARNLPLVDGKGTVNLSAGVSAYAREHQLELWHYGRRIS
jgi:hypothetical protein